MAALQLADLLAYRNTDTDPWTPLWEATLQAVNADADGGETVPTLYMIFKAVVPVIGSTAQARIAGSTYSTTVTLTASAVGDECHLTIITPAV